MSKDEFPLATMAAYGPDNTAATKLTVAVFSRRGREAAAMRSWLAASGDIRRNPQVAAEISAFLSQHRVKNTVMSDGILGCPHQEGVDYPLGESCPSCPFWATVDRWTGEPLPGARLTAAQILAELSVVRSRQPVAMLAQADQQRASLVGPLLAAMERVLDDPEAATDGEAQILAYGAYLLSSWREPRGHQLIIRWLSLPREQVYELGGDIVTQDGRRFLASTCAGQVEAIKTLILDRDADPFCRGEAIGALAVLAAWGELPYESVVEYLSWIAREGLEREGGAWDLLALYCADMGAREVFPELRRAYDEDLIDPTIVEPSELDEAKGGPDGATYRAFRAANQPVTNVAEATAWWACFHGEAGRERHQLYAGPSSVEASRTRAPKAGRNDPCPCGSGKKYKKCCMDKDVA